MRFSEENGAEIDAAGMECRLKVRLLPAQAEGVAPVAGRNHLQVRLQLRRIRICARATRDVLLHPQVRRKELPGGGGDTERRQPAQLLRLQLRPLRDVRPPVRTTMLTKPAVAEKDHCRSTADGREVPLTLTASFGTRRIVRDDIEEQLESGMARQDPFYDAAEDELLPSYEDAVEGGRKGQTHSH